MKVRTISRGWLLLSVLALPLYIIRFRLGVPTNLLELVAGLGIVFTFLAVWPKQRGLPLVAVWSAALFIVGAGVGVLLAADRQAALGIWKSWIVLPVLVAWWYWEVAASDEPRLHRGMALTLTVTATGVALIALAQLFPLVQHWYLAHGNPDLQHYFAEHPIRVFAGYESPNYLAMFLVPSLFMVWGMVGKDTRHTIWFRGAIVLIVAAILASRSNGGLLGLLAGISWVGIAWGVREFRHARWAVIVSILVLGAGVFWLGYSPRSGGNDVRREIYGYAIQMVQEHPMLGVGLHNFQSAVQPLSGANTSFVRYGLPYALHAHNLFLELWLSTTVIGLLAFLVMVAGALLRLFHESKRSSDPIWIMAALVAILAQGLVDTTYFKNDLSILTFLLFAVALCWGKAGSAMLKR